jgi:hypothetical protein
METKQGVDLVFLVEIKGKKDSGRNEKSADALEEPKNKNKPD